jgi:3-methyl-2-oxobutanoate hydroxymethyltransferase
MTITISQLLTYKSQGRAIAALTATEYATAKIMDKAGVDLILVGDSLGMVSLGYKNTLPVTLDEIIHHAKAVGRGVSNALLVVDLPFLSYQISPEQAIASAGRILKETPAQGVKLEGGYPDIVKTIEKLVNIGIPVMGHIGLTPQSVHQTGYRRQGNEPSSAKRILAQAQNIEAAGAFALVIEHIPSPLAEEVSKSLSIPTIGIGAGNGCDGQILVSHDLLGLSEWQPSFVKKYADLQTAIADAVSNYCNDVRDRSFPDSSQS